VRNAYYILYRSMQHTVSRGGTHLSSLIRIIAVKRDPKLHITDDCSIHLRPIYQGKNSRVSSFMFLYGELSNRDKGKDLIQSVKKIVKMEKSLTKIGVSDNLLMALEI